MLFDVSVPYIQAKLGIGFQVSWVKVKVIVTKNRKNSFSSITSGTIDI